MSAHEKSKNLIDLVKEKRRYKHYSLRTEQSYCGWVKRFVLFQNKRHPSEMSAVEVTAYQQALSSLLFLYREVLGCGLP